MGAEQDLLDARRAYAQGDWRASHDLFSRAGGLAGLTTDDLAALGMAAWRLGRTREAIQIAEQVFHRLVAQDDPASAAMKAVELSLQWINRGDLTIARAWMNRARRIVDLLPENPVHGYLMYLDAVVAAIEKDYDSASRWALSLQDLGRRLESPVLISLGLTAGGLAAIGRARTDEAWPQLDEAMPPVLAGQVPLDWAGDIYCWVIDYCYRVADLTRMRAWVAAMERWCEDPAVAASTHGTVCEVHRLQLLSATEGYADVEQRLAATGAALEEVNAWAAAEGYYELGEVRRRRGDIDGARGAFEKARELGYDPQPGSALLRCQLGERTAALHELRMRLEAEDDLGRAPMLRAAVEIALARDCVDEADGHCRRLEESATLFGTPGFRAWALHARGAVLVKQGRPADALPLLRAALRTYRNLMCRFDIARVYEWMSLAHAASGDASAAAADADAAAAMYAELDVAHASGRGRPATAGVLTRREVEVLTGVSNGATNREVAEKLFISEKTVGRHLANIYAKLGVSSRTAAVARARENGMLHGA